MRITGQLPCGIEIEGKLYRDFELREQIVADEIEVFESEHGPRALKNDAFFGVCLMARRLTLIGLGPPVTPAMIMAMSSRDFVHLAAAGREQAAGRDSFRDAAQAAPDALSGTPQTGL
jgi:phage FluMu protein gp41